MHRQRTLDLKALKNSTLNYLKEDFFVMKYWFFTTKERLGHAGSCLQSTYHRSQTNILNGLLSLHQHSFVTIATDLEAVDRLYYLKAFLKRRAANLVENIAITAGNYGQT
ncbi:uncharacterized protein LOC143187630 [Calliopsis andreniformis]|uniref:uncharacterized protein LOC143187630 n=1 Tax=Calliopsis andreniformis TaxID=337506 RepID=UPI003FCEA28D